MSCFDSVYVKCPTCGCETEFQSKADKCAMHSYFLKSVPIKIAVDLDNAVKVCSKCGTHLQLSAVGVPARVALVVETKPLDDEEE